MGPIITPGTGSAGPRPWHRHAAGNGACKPRATVWLAGNTSDARFVDYLGGGAWAAGLNDLVEEALDQLLAAG